LLTVNVLPVGDASASILLGETAPSSTAADPVGAEFSAGSYLDVIDTESLPLTPLTSVVRVTSPPEEPSLEETCRVRSISLWV
jgi:hypothetical protein